MTQRKGLRGILALLCAMTLLIGAIGPAAATEAAVPESVAVTTAAAPEGTPAPSAQTPKGVIASWQWVDPNGYLKAGVLEQPNVNEQNPVQFSDVTVFLPVEITATVEGSAQAVTIPVKGWECQAFGDVVTGGEFTFTAKLAEGYVLADNAAALNVKVKLGQEQPVADADTTTTENTLVPAVETLAANDGAVAVKSEVADGTQAELDLSQGSVTITADQATVAGSAPVFDPDGYRIISSAGATANTITIESGSANITLSNVFIKSDGVTPLYVKKGASAVINLEGSNAFGKGWDDVHTTNIVVEDNGHLTLKGKGSLYCNESLGKNKLSVGTGAEVTIQDCEVYLRSSYVPAVTGSGTVTVDHATLKLRADPYDGHSSLRLCEKDISLKVVNSGTLEVDEKKVEFGAKSLILENSTLLTVGGASVTLNPNTLSVQNSQINIAGSISEDLKNNSGSWSGLVFEGDSGTVYGSYTISGNYEIPAGKTLTIPQGAALTVTGSVTLNGTLTNQGQLHLDSQNALTGGGTLNGDGSEQFTTVYPEISVPELVYDGTDQAGKISAAIPETITLCGKEITLTQTDISQWQPSYQREGQPVGQVVDAGTYTVTYTKDGKTVSKEFTVSKSSAQIETLTADKSTYTYGETVSVTAKPVATGAAAMSLNPPVSGQMALFQGDTQVSEAVDAGTDGSYTMRVNTIDLGAGSHALTARFVGNSNMADVEDSLTVKVEPKALIVTSADATSRPYDATDKVVITNVVLTGILNGDDVKVDISNLTGTLPSANVGEYKEITLPQMTLTGDKAGNYTLTQPTGAVTTTVTISKATPVISFAKYTGKTYDGKAMANPTKDQLTVTGADFSEVTFTWYKDAKAEENKLTSAPTDAGTYVLVAAVAKTDSHGETTAQKGITITKADATDAMKQAKGTLTKNHAASLSLPKLPEGASYGTPTTNDGSFVVDLKVENGKLSYKGTGNVKNDGKYEVQVPVTGAKNYSDYTIVVTFTGEEKLPVTLTAANFTTTYNGSEVFPEAIHKTATYDGEAVSGKWSFVGGNPKDAGTYKDIVLKFTPKDTEKYAEASIEMDVVIKKAPLKVSVKLSKTKIAVNSKLPTVSLSYSGLMGNDKMEPKVEPKFEGMPSGKKTGTYTIKLKNVDDMKDAINALEVSKNYEITYVTSAKLSVVSGNNPLTADTSNIGMWTAIMIISGIGLIVVLVLMVVLNKKSKRRRPRYRRTPPKQED